MGGDQDIEPPLFTTAARQITLIGIDPSCLENPKTADKERLTVLTQVTEGIVKKLGGYAKAGVTIDRNIQSPVTNITVTDTESDPPDGYLPRPALRRVPRQGIVARSSPRAAGW
jgi:hypothetical protein